MDPSPPPPPLPLPSLQDYRNVGYDPRRSRSSSRMDGNDTTTDHGHTPTLYIPIAAPLTPLPSPKPTVAPQLPLSSSLGPPSLNLSSASTSACTSASGAGAFTASDYPSLPPNSANLHTHPSLHPQFSLDDALALFASIPTSPSAVSSPTTLQASFITNTASQVSASTSTYLPKPLSATYTHGHTPHPTFPLSTTLPPSSTTSASSSSLPPTAPITTSRRAFLAALLPLLTPAEMLFLSQRLAPLLKRDFLADLPAELGLLILSYVGAPGDGSPSSSYPSQSSSSLSSSTSSASGAAGLTASGGQTGPYQASGASSHPVIVPTAEPDVRSLIRAGMVSRRWRALSRDDAVWKGMCLEAGFGREAREAQRAYARAQEKVNGKDENGVGARTGRGKGKAREMDGVRAPQMQHSLSAASTSSASSYASTSVSMSSTRASSPVPREPEEEEGYHEYEERNALSASTSTIVPRASVSASTPYPARLLSLSPLPPLQTHNQPPSQHEPQSQSHVDLYQQAQTQTQTQVQPQPQQPPFSYRRHFRASWRVLTAWRRGGALLAQHRLDGAGGTSTGVATGASAPANPTLGITATSTPSSTGPGTGAGSGSGAGTTASAPAATATATVTSLALDGALVVVGLASSRVLLFSARTGVLVRTLRGHESGVWGVGLVSAPVVRDPDVGDHKNQAGDEEGDVEEGRRQRKRRRVGRGGGWMEAPAQAQAWVLPDALRRAVGVPVRAPSGEEDGLVLPGEARASDIGDEGSEDDFEDDDSYDDYKDGNEDGYEEEYDEEAAAEAADRAYARARRAEAAQQPFDHTYSMPGWGPASYAVPVSVTGSSSGHGTADAGVPYSREDVEAGDDEDGGDVDYGRRGKTRIDGQMRMKKGKRGALVVSGGCDKVIKVWDAGSGQCIYTLTGHTSTVRALRLVPPVPGFSPFASAPPSARTSNSPNLAPATFISASPTIDSRSAPLALTGARDATIRVWDIRLGYCVRVLEGHTGSVRCLDVWCGVGEEVLESDEANTHADQSRQRSKGLGRRVRQRRCVSGSYDGTCRLWDVDTGECIHVLRGHFSQIYSVAFDGVRVVSGGLDTTVRVWDAESGQCVALLQGHTALVCQLQLFRVPNASLWAYPPSPLPASSSSAAASSSSLLDRGGGRVALSGTAGDTEYTTILATGGSDGRVITFSLATYTALHRIAAHDSSVTAMQLGGRFLVTAGNDGRVRLYEARGGGPPSHRQGSADARHSQQFYHNADAGPEAAGNSPADPNGGLAFSPMHDQRARDAERGARLGVYRYVRDLSSAGETVWKAAFGRDTLVLAGRKGGRGVVEVWTMDPRNKMVRLKGKVKDRDV